MDVFVPRNVRGACACVCVCVCARARVFMVVCVRATVCVCVCAASCCTGRPRSIESGIYSTVVLFDTEEREREREREKFVDNQIEN